MRAMHKVKVGIIGATGFSGVELMHLLLGHPGVEVDFLASDQFAGKPVSSLLGPKKEGREGGQTPSQPPFITREEAKNRLFKLPPASSCVFLATPAEVSQEWLPLLQELKIPVIDLSGAFRLESPFESAQYYGAPMPAEVYGLPELNREKILKSKTISNPGCYATAVSLALAPLLRADLIERTQIVVNALSGVTGAGRKSSEEFSFSSIESDVRAYRVFKHQHEPEIRQTLSQCTKGESVKLTFIPHLLPVARGILTTSVATLKQGVVSEQVTEAFLNLYANEPFVDLASDSSQVRLHDTVGTNFCKIGFTIDSAERRIVVVSSIDNLIKGAAGQAVQNFNLIFGFKETTALSTLRRFLA